MSLCIEILLEFKLICKFQFYNKIMNMKNVSGAPGSKETPRHETAGYFKNLNALYISNSKSFICRLIYI
jgi:hypothetical protein